MSSFCVSAAAVLQHQRRERSSTDPCKQFQLSLRPPRVYVVLGVPPVAVNYFTLTHRTETLVQIEDHSYTSSVHNIKGKPCWDRGHAYTMWALTSVAFLTLPRWLAAKEPLHKSRRNNGFVSMFT